MSSGKRVLDERPQLRYIVTGLGQQRCVPQEAGFDITAASELMAILCLAEDEADLRRRIETYSSDTSAMATHSR